MKLPLINGQADLLREWARSLGRRDLNNLVLETALREAARVKRKKEREEWRAHKELMACVEKVH
jgi:uncharacterized protein (DUF1778 family)